MNRPHARHRRADRHSGHGVFGKRRPEHSLWPEFLHQTTRRALDGFVVVGVEAENEYSRIAPHLLRGRFAQSIDVGQESLVSSPRRHWCIASLAGKKARLGKCHGVGNLSVNFSIDLGATRWKQLSTNKLDLVAFDPRLEVSPRAITRIEILIGADVFAPAIGTTFDENWT